MDFLHFSMKRVFIILFLIFFTFSCSKEEKIIIKKDPSGTTHQGVKIIQTSFQNTELIIAGSPDKNFIISFENVKVNGAYPEFTVIQDSLPVIMKDEYNGRWNILGEALSGPAKGTKLIPTNSMMGYWFSFGAFFPGMELFDGDPVDVNVVNEISEGWLINKNMVYAGSVESDAIPALDNPVHIQYKERNFLNGFFVKDDDLVLGIYQNGQAIAYPVNILNWHESVNDLAGDVPITISYCPLTGTAVSWNRKINNTETTFGVSGLLYNSNLILYDRETRSFWSQMLMKCVRGDLIGRKAGTTRVLETTWKTWKTIFPETDVLSTNTGYDRNYEEYPFEDYRTNNDLIGYPLVYDDSRVPRKERVHAIFIGGKAMVFRFSSFYL